MTCPALPVPASALEGEKENSGEASAFGSRNGPFGVHPDRLWKQLPLRSSSQQQADHAAPGNGAVGDADYGALHSGDAESRDIGSGESGGERYSHVGGSGAASRAAVQRTRQHGHDPRRRSADLYVRYRGTPVSMDASPLSGTRGEAPCQRLGQPTTGGLIIVCLATGSLTGCRRARSGGYSPWQGLLCGLW